MLLNNNNRFFIIYIGQYWILLFSIFPSSILEYRVAQNLCINTIVSLLFGKILRYFDFFLFWNFYRSITNTYSVPFSCTTDTVILMQYFYIFEQKWERWIYLFISLFAVHVPKTEQHLWPHVYSVMQFRAYFTSEIESVVATMRYCEITT